MLDEETDAPVSPPKSPSTGGTPVDPSRLTRAVVRAKYAILAAVVLGLLIGAAAAKTLVPRRYDALAVLAWERTVTANSVDMGADRELRTLAESVKLAENLSEIRERMGLGTTLERLGQRIEVKTGKDSNLLTVAASAEDPEEAAALARTTVEVYLEHRTETERKRMSEEIARLEANAEAAQSELERERTAFDAFRRDNGILDLSIERQSALSHAGKLRAEADLARANAEGQRARIRIFTDAARDQSPIALLAEKEFRPDQKRLAEARAELAALEGRLAPDHPKVASLVAEVAALASKAGAKEFTARSERTVGRNPQWEAIQLNLADAKAGELQAGTLETTYEQLARRADDEVSRLTRVEGEAARLYGRVKVAEQHVTELQTLATIAKDAARAPAPGFRVLTHPRVPDLPTSSSRKLVVVAVPGAAFVLMLLLTVMRELRDAQIVSSRELAYWGRGPVIAVSTWPRGADASPLEPLAFDLVDVLGEDPDVVWLPADDSALDATRTLAAEVQASSLALGEPTLLRDPSSPRERRILRHARQVVVVAMSGSTQATRLRTRFAELGHPAVGFVLLGAEPGASPMPDRVGDVDAFAAYAPAVPESG